MKGYYKVSFLLIDKYDISNYIIIEFIILF